MAAPKKMPVCPICSSGYPTFVIGVKCANCDYEGDKYEFADYDTGRGNLKFFRVSCNDGRRVSKIVKARSEKDAEATMRKWFRYHGINLALGSSPKAVFISFQEQDDYLVREGRGPNAKVIRRKK